MKKSGLYLPNLYVQNIGRYYDGRKAWKKKWGNKQTRKYLTAALLTAMFGIGTVGYAASHASEFWGSGKVVEVSIEGVSDQEVVNGQNVENVILSGSAVDNILSMYEESEQVRMEAESVIESSSAPGAITKEPKDTLIVLDPGHGGIDDGCVKNGVLEKDVNLQICLAIQTQLEALGYQVKLTRTSDEGLTLEERVNMANQSEADLYVSIHQNSSEFSKVNGMEVLYSSQNKGEASERLSRLIHKYVVQDTGVTGRQILEEESLYVIRECTMPSCLVETGFLSNATERKNLIDSEYQEKIAEGIASGIELFFHPRTMYLTFDDGPSKENTEAVLDILKARGIKATFFVVGENVRRYPDVARRIVEEGHTIGIHCDNHEYESLYTSVDSYLEDFQKAYDTVKEVTGVEVKLFRFPGGSINDFNKKVYKKIIEAMTEQGFIYYDWNASLDDAITEAEPETLIENALSSTLDRERVVMLAHDVVQETGLCLDKLLDELLEYQMEPLTEDVEPVQF